MPSFQEKIERMRRIFRAQETYGEGTPAEQATRFRFQEMMEDIIRLAKEHSFPPGEKKPDPVHLLISLSGFSPATTILAYELIRPEKVLLVYSEKAEDSINTIAQYIVAPDKLRHSDFRFQRCDPTDPLGIYRIVSEELRRLSRPGSDRPSAMLDITGGKKVMSATAALAAWQLDLPLCYIESNFDPELRQPVPGSEQLLRLDNPTTLFGDQEMQNASHMFRSGAFDAARSRYEDLSNRIAEPSKARFMRDLSSLYQAWCDLDLNNLPARIAAVADRLTPSLSGLQQEVLGRIQVQLDFLRTLCKDVHLPILLCYYLLGTHYLEVVHRYDFAALLFYRTVEGCLQQRLERRYPGFTCRKPDYTIITPDTDALLRAYNAAAEAISPQEREGALPRHIGFMNSAGLLYALHDELLSRAQVLNPKALSHLRALSDIRNQSVLAHGYRSISPDDIQQLQGKALQFLRAFWALYEPAQDIDRMCDLLRFIRGDS